MRVFWPLLAAITATGCSSTLPSCASAPDLSRLSASERAALEHSISAHSKTCHSSKYQCAFRVFHTKDSGLLVTADFLYPDKSSGQCVQPIGGSAMDLYDATGKFRRAVPSL
jgi:hypothetical protein